MYPFESDFFTLQFSSVTQSCLTVWDPMDCSMPDLPVHRHLSITNSQSLLKLMCWVGDVISSSIVTFTSHLQSSPASESFPMSQLQHHSSKASVLQCSAFFIVQLSHPYMTTGKTVPLIRWTFVGKVMALLFNMLSRLVITFLPRSKHLLISWLQSPSAVILKSKTINSVTASPSICHEVMGPVVMILVFYMWSFFT